MILKVMMRMLFVDDEDSNNVDNGEDDDDEVGDIDDVDDVDDDDEDDDIDDDVNQSVSAVDGTSEALCSLSRHNVHKLSIETRIMRTTRSKDKILMID